MLIESKKKVKFWLTNKTTLYPVKYLYFRIQIKQLPAHLGLWFLWHGSLFLKINKKNPIQTKQHPPPVASPTSSPLQIKQGSFINGPTGC